MHTATPISYGGSLPGIKHAFVSNNPLTLIAALSVTRFNVTYLPTPNEAAFAPDLNGRDQPQYHQAQGADSVPSVIFLDAKEPETHAQARGELTRHFAHIAVGA